MNKKEFIIANEIDRRGPKAGATELPARYYEESEYTEQRKTERKRMKIEKIKTWFYKFLFLVILLLVAWVITRP